MRTIYGINKLFFFLNKIIIKKGFHDTIYIFKKILFRYF